ncbi:MAG: cysteine desulfurase [Phycisphaerales bacterium]|nr:cysteine desulfurase [Phycisphaerales bacterium]
MTSAVSQSTRKSPPATGRLDVRRIREDFPILDTKVNGRPLVYLDNAATAQKPRIVLEAMDRYYREQNANVHRGVHHLSVVATKAYEDARLRVQRFIGAECPQEIVFVRSATEAINLVAQSYGRPRLRAGDEIVISAMEHHSNIVPWQMLCGQTGAILRVAPIDDAGELMLDGYEALLGPRTRLVSLCYVSNALGTINPVGEAMELAHARGIPVMLDGAQAAPHLRLDVRALDCEFLAITGHKLFGPTGIGVLYGKRSLLEAMEPYQGGGDMIKSVTFEKTEYNDLPHKFEAGTPNIAGTIGLAAAIDYVERIGLEAVAAYEDGLLRRATEVLSAIPQVRIIGTARHKAAVVSFVVDCAHAHDVGTVLDLEGIAVRTGHHCAQPVMDRFGVPATARASMAFYNTMEEIDALADGVRKVVKMFG